MSFFFFVIMVLDNAKNSVSVHVQDSADDDSTLVETIFHQLNDTNIDETVTIYYTRRRNNICRE